MLDRTRWMFVHETLRDSRALPLYEREYDALIKAGFAECRPHTDVLDNQIFYAMDIDTQAILGGIVFRLDSKTLSGLIRFAFVPDEYRRQGVYRKLRMEVEALMRGAGMTEVESAVHCKNTAMIAAATSCGSHASYMRLSKRLV